MQRPLFMDQPGAWTTTPRTGTSRVNYGSAVTIYKRRRTWVDHALRIAAALLVLAAFGVLVVGAP